MKKHALLSIAALALIAAALSQIPATGPVSTERSHQPELSVARPEIAPAPPEAIPSRKDGGPDLRRAWEQRRLADPATGRIPPDIHRREQEFARGLPRWRTSAWADRAAAAGGDKANAADKFVGWTGRGPYNIGGRTRALAIDVSDPTYRTLLAGGVSGGMWRTDDDGANWDLTTGSSQLHSVTCVAQDTRPGLEFVWYYGTGEQYGNSASGGAAPYRGDGIFKSTDGGQSWALLPATTTGNPQQTDNPFNYVWRVVTDASEPTLDELYVAAYGIIYRSTDGGESFTEVLGDPGQTAKQTDVTIASDGVVYASLSSDGGQDGIYRSPDGETWTDITPSGLTNHGRIVLGLAPSDEDVLYALVSNGGFYKYTYLSGDGSGSGGLWENRSANLQNLPGPGGSWDYNSYGGYCQMVTVNPADLNEVYIGGIHLIRSRDGFATGNQTRWVGGWQYSNHHADLHWMLYQPGSDLIAYTGSDGGVHKTYNSDALNIAWQSLNNGYNTSQFYTTAIDMNIGGSDIVVGGMQDNGTWWTGVVQPDASWIEQFGGDGSYCAVSNVSESPTTYYYSVQNGVVYRVRANSNGGTLDWTRVDPTSGGSYLFINPFILDPSDTDMMYLGTNHGVWRNSNLRAIPVYNNNPTSINWDHLTTYPSGPAVTALAVSRSGSRNLYYLTSAGTVHRVVSAHTAEPVVDPDWLNSGTQMIGKYGSSLAVHPEDDQQLLVALSNYSVESLWYTDDAGANWTGVEGNLAGDDGPSVRTVAIVPFGGNDIYFAGTSTGLYSTMELDGDQTVWSQESADLIGNVVVDMLATRSADGLIVAATHGKGVFSVNIPTETAAPDLPSSTSYLAQNAPNPFNPRTTIAFVLGADGHAALEVFDLRGRLIRTLIDQQLTAGEHSVIWDGVDQAGRSVSAGTYLYRVRSGSWSEQRKMTLLE